MKENVKKLKDLTGEDISKISHALSKTTKSVFNYSGVESKLQAKAILKETFYSPSPEQSFFSNLIQKIYQRMTYINHRQVGKKIIAQVKTAQKKFGTRTRHVKFCQD